jgi:hypothetical protein
MVKPTRSDLTPILFSQAPHHFSLVSSIRSMEATVSSMDMGNSKDTVDFLNMVSKTTTNTIKPTNTDSKADTIKTMVDNLQLIARVVVVAFSRSSSKDSRLLV